MQAYLADRSEPLNLADALQITGPLPVIASSKLSVPTGGQISLLKDEFPAGYTLSAMLDVKNMVPASTLRLACADDVGPHTSLHVGEETATSSLNQLSQDQLFLSFDTAPLPAGCSLQAVIDNGRNGKSQPYTLAHIVRLPRIDSFDPVPASVRRSKRVASVHPDRSESGADSGSRLGCRESRYDRGFADADSRSRADAGVATRAARSSSLARDAAGLVARGKNAASNHCDRACSGNRSKREHRRSGNPAATLAMANSGR